MFDNQLNQLCKLSIKCYSSNKCMYQYHSNQVSTSIKCLIEFFSSLSYNLYNYLLYLSILSKNMNMINILFQNYMNHLNTDNYYLQEFSSQSNLCNQQQSLNIVDINLSKFSNYCLNQCNIHFNKCNYLSFLLPCGL